MHDNNTINKVLLLGEISRAPRWHKNGPDGAVLCFSLITRETHIHAGKPVEQTEEHAVKVPERRLETELKPGQRVHIEGRLKTTPSIDEQNVRRYKTEIVATRVTVI